MKNKTELGIIVDEIVNYCRDNELDDNKVKYVLDAIAYRVKEEIGID